MGKKIKLFNFNNDNEKENKHLKEHPYFHKNFRMIVCGVSGSGKTQFLYNILFTKEFLLKMCKKSNIVSFIPSNDVVEEMNEIALKENFDCDNFKIYPYWDNKKCEAEFDSLDKKKENIFIFDDVAFLPDFSSVNKKTILDRCACAGRHKNLYYLILSQRYTHLNENLRSNNCSILVIFNGLNSKEFERIYIENFNLYNRDEFYNFIKENLKDKFQFIIFNKKNNKIFNNEFEEIFIE